MITAEKPTLTKKVQLTVRLSVDHKERIARGAAAMGQTLNSFAVSELVKRANEIIEREEMRLLSQMAGGRDGSYKPVAARHSV